MSIINKISDWFSTNVAKFYILEESKDSCEKKDVSSDGTALGNHFNETF